MTSSGTYTFNNLKILSSGTYKLVVTSSDMTTVETSTTTITNYAYSMTITSENLTPTVNYNFNVEVSIFGEDQELFTRSCTIALSDNLSPTTLSGENNLSTSTGIKTFSIYFTSSGSKTLEARCPETSTGTSVFYSVSITVKQLKLILVNFVPVRDI